MLPGLLASEGCVCGFTDNASEADYTVKIDAAITRDNYAESNMVFCYAGASVNIRDNGNYRSLHPSIEEAKGGSITYKAAWKRASKKSFAKKSVL
jgi:hypothetical protein